MLTSHSSFWIKKNMASIRSRPLSSTEARFTVLLEMFDECRLLQEEMGVAWHVLSPFVPVEDIGDDTQPEVCWQVRVPYDTLFFPSANCLFDATSGGCPPVQEIRLRLGMFALGATRFKEPDDGRYLDILLRCQDEKEQYWLGFRLHCAQRCV